MIAKVAICGILLCCYIVNVHCFLGPIRSLKSRELKQSAAVISKVLNSHDGLVKDMISAACLSTVGDLIAQAVDQKGSNVTISFDLARMRQFTLFGFFDGAMAHTWYHTLDGIITGSSLKDLILRISTDTLVYTPFWCAWFLSFFAMLERSSLTKLLAGVRKDWWAMVMVSTRFYFPLALLLYTIIPIHYRVVTAATGTMVATTIVSLWKSSASANQAK